MELIQIIESTVFLFSVGLVVFLILSYLLFQVKNHSVNFPRQKELFTGEVSIIYQHPVVEENKAEPAKKKTNGRFIVLNEILKESTFKPETEKKQVVNSRFYIYKPGRHKIVKSFGLSGIKD